MAAETFGNEVIGQPQRITLPVGVGDVRLINAPGNAREWTVAPGANFVQWKDGEGVSDEDAIGADFSTEDANTKPNFPLPGTRGGVKRNLNGPKLAIAGEITVQVIEIIFF